ncbi:DoxX family protein [Vibrio sp. SS-MA-C1-2]|uniref:DoxX family protein n=1 Tax=Vibrio sp. SS-MA-C1-2 TaxID=2908646 RepID=UPI001F397585|nr:DoxX family protein [Vibrio sp. SS-MA-C1-2]UJF18369.1 DoxX family protein [Vibrio sp. SS-MA-C1-2]
MNTSLKLASPLARLLLVLLFLISGFGKVTGYGATEGYMAAMGVPTFLLPLVIITELGFSLLILVGYKCRLMAFLLAGYSILTALIFHHDFADQMQFINFMKNVSMAGGFLLLVINGAGAYSIDEHKKKA